MYQAVKYIVQLVYSDSVLSYKCIKISHVVDVYVAELMVESNVTLEAQTIVSVLNKTSSLTVTDAMGSSHTVTLLFTELVAGIVLEHFFLSFVIIPNS